MARFLSEIFVYPVKSLGGVSLESAEITARGIKHDRKWMLVDERGSFLSQRMHPRMALLQTSLSREGVIVFQKNDPAEKVVIPFDQTENEKIEVTIWNDTCEAEIVDAKMNDWFSDFLSFNCRLVKMAEGFNRLVDPAYARNGETVNFPDAFPFLAIGQSSLDDLNGRLETPVPMNRFRPNFVIGGSGAFEEDGWDVFRIGDAAFKAAKPCARCVMTTVDQETGAGGKEPLKTLAAYRKVGNKILFGQNLLCKKAATVRVGDEVKIINVKEVQ